MHRGVSVTLPEETVRLLNRLGERGEWASIIDLAVRRYAEHAGPAEVRRRLLAGTGTHPRRDDPAEAWSGLGEES
ncbi:MAG: hypothetical protein U0S49_03725 [Rhodospirillales bacterium]|jgi:hypothetical protein|nr:hypothetical protein [Rhodospirillales bacterium]